MASTLRHIELPIPFRGMNTDTSPSQIDPSYTPYARNVILNNTTQVRTRIGWSRRAGYGTIYGVPADGWISGAVEHQAEDGSAAVLVSAVEGDRDWPSGYPAGFNYEETFSVALSDRDQYVISVAANDTVSGAVGDVYNDLYATPIGNSLQYDGTTYYISFDDNRSSRLCRWAGQNATVYNAGTVSINNGSTTATLSGVSANSLKNRFFFTNAGPSPGFQYLYRIVAHTPGSATFEIEREFGLGAGTGDVPNLAGADYEIYSASFVVNAPLQPGCVGLFRDRIFLGRGVPAENSFYTSFGLGRWRPNYIYWSAPGEPEKWPQQNFIVVGESDEPIMGMATTGDVLLIFQRTKTWALTGYDEASFNLSLVSNNVGCVHSASISLHEDSVIWASERGVHRFNGSSLVNLMSPSTGVGVTADYLAIVAANNGTFSEFAKRTVATGVHNDILWVSAQIHDDTPMADCFVCDLTTGGWVRAGNSNLSGQLQPTHFVKVKGKLWGISAYQAVDLSDCFNVEGLVSPALYLADEDYTAAAATTTNTITAELHYADLRLAAATTVRVRGVQIEHNCHYFNATSSPRVAWAVELAYDSNIDVTELVVGDVDARYVGNVSSPFFDRYYTDRFTDSSFPTEGAVFRVKLTKTAQAHSAKLFRVFLVTDGQATFDGRVDNATL